VARSAKPFAVPFPRCFRVAVIPAAPQRSRARKLTINTFDNNFAPKSIKELSGTVGAVLLAYDVIASRHLSTCFVLI
jgi:hypothetical protein